jgi:hypothetical protein
MATKTQDKNEITFLDGTTIEPRPLKLSLLKPFMKRFAELASVADDNEKSMDVLIDCVQIALQQYKKEISEDRENLEEILDLPTVYKIIEIASGIELGETQSLVGSLSR